MLTIGRKFQRLATARKRGQKQNTLPYLWPAAQLGVDAVSAATAIPPQAALALTNMIPSDTGVAVRKGWIEWCEAVPSGDGIKTIIPLTKLTEGGEDKLFVATSDGIYDATDAGDAPTKVLDFSIKTTLAGWCSWHHFTTVAGQFILLADEANGYFVYTVSTDTWAAGSVTEDPAITATDTITAADIAFVTVWKNRIWLVERDTGTAWYMTVGVISGAVAKPFYFGNKFKYGGYLKSLWNWTLDGGDGSDDLLVAVSSGGDAIFYQGTDPNSITTFNMKGTWFIGRVMAGRRQGSDMGGELLLLSNFGVLQASRLLAGGDEAALQTNQALSWKINPRVNATMQRLDEDYGWEVVLAPREQLLMIVTPKETGMPYRQYVYSTVTKAWCAFADLPVKTAAMWKSKLYFGTDDNRVCTYDGWLDRVLLDEEEASFEPVEWESLTGFDPLQAPAQFKRVHFLRPLFIGQTEPPFKIVARYDFNLSPPGGSAVFPPVAGGVWDLSVWDFATWGAGYQVSQAPKGAYGMGRYVAHYLRGRSGSQLVHVGTDVLFDKGGLL